MKKLSLLTIVFILFLMSCVSAATYGASDVGTCKPQVALINQDPYPALPGSYVNLVFQITDIDGENCDKGVWFKLLPSYPFSLNPDDDGLRTLGDNTFLANYNNAWMVPFKLKVDKDALDGNYKVEANYNMNAVYQSSNTKYTKRFDIEVEDSRTNFDAVIQETTSSEVTIALANTGKYAANSVVLRIPEQDDFRVLGTDGQMVGNLESGDYTIVSFEVSQKMSKKMMGTPDENQELPILLFQIYYTDNLGERRIVDMKLPLNLRDSSAIGEAMALGNFPGRLQQQSSSWSWWQYSLLVVAMISALFVIKKVVNKRRLSNKKKTPDWVKNS